MTKACPAKLYFLLTLLCTLSVNSYALPFEISLPENTQLPTKVSENGIAYAYYLIKNNTSTIRNGNYVKWLPPHVTQNLSDNTYCAASFNLQAKGLPGDSCILKLNINGDTTPTYSKSITEQKLLICFPGGKTCTGPSTENELHVLSSSSTRFAYVVGHYADNTTDTTTFPLLAISQNGGSDWTSKITSASLGSGLPTDLKIGGSDEGDAGFWNYFYHPSCTGQHCIAVGQYENNSGYYPTISHSADNGATWNSVVNSASVANGLPLDILAGSPLDAPYSNVLLSSSCFKSTCAAVGSYANTDTPFLAFLTVSQDAGQHWVSKADSTTLGTSLPADLLTSTYSVLNDVNCTSNVCAAVGQYITFGAENPAFPLITQSQDGGNTWQVAVSSASPSSLPADFDGLAGGQTFDNFLFKISCSGKVCAAVGSYQTTASGNPNYPLVLSSQDSGTHWKTVIDSSSIGGGLPNDITHAGNPAGNLFWGVSCSGSICIANGRYKTVGGTWYPNISTSQDGGKTWKSRLDSSSLLTVLPADYNTGSNLQYHAALLAASCAGNLCVSAGHYEATGGAVYPLLVVSHDGGISWENKIDSSSIGNSLPSDMFANGSSDNTLYGVSCSESFCFAAGTYQTTASGYPSSPLLLISQNAGKSWVTVVASHTMNALPSDIDNGVFGAGDDTGAGIQSGGTSMGG